MNSNYVKLKDLIGSTFEVLDVTGYQWKSWDNIEKKMLSSDVYLEGYRKLWQVQTNKGQLDLGSGQLGNLLESTFINGQANLIGQTFEVRSNGKAGMDIRYYFNPLKATKLAPPEPVLNQAEQDEIKVSELPF